MHDAEPHPDAHAGARHFCELVRDRLVPEKRRNVFVAGCGPGEEALFIRKNLDVPVTDVDISQHWNSGFGTGTTDFTLLVTSILDVPIPDETFDIVFYHHVLEHVDDPARSLDELWRLLVPGGLIYVGTPNRHRAVGYLGSHDARRSDKIKWNVADYKYRLKGKFRNEYGAHAGFTQKELDGLLDRRFTDVEALTAEYLSFKYGSRVPASALNLVCTKPLIEIAAPSVYSVAMKPRG